MAQYSVETLPEANRRARERLAVAAVDRGANAVVAMRYSSAEVAELMSEIVAYGTAVTIRRPPAMVNV